MDALKTRGFENIDKLFIGGAQRQAYVYSLLYNDLELLEILRETEKYCPEDEFIKLSTYGDIVTVKLFLEYGAVNRPSDKALVSAAKNGHIEIVKLLLDFGADYSKLPSSGMLQQQIFVNAMRVPSMVSTGIRKIVSEMLDYRPVNSRRLACFRQ